MKRPESFGCDADRRVIEADEIHVGPIHIVKTSDTEGGIWIGDGHKQASVAIFHTQTQVGVGLYAKGFPGACNVCLMVDNDGGGAIQFARGKDVVYLTFDDVVRLVNDEQ